jgi:ATP-dependent Clp protease ATP-binding subunit ClpC
MFLMGIISEGTGIGFKVLNDLEITLKDVRMIVEKLIGYGNEYYDREIVFTKRAKKILEVAWQKAKKYNKPRIMSEHLLYAITTEPSSIAMKALEQLGVDAVEIRQGILKELGSLQ